MKNEDGNLSIEASLVMPIFVLYFILIISIGVFVFENGLSRIKHYRSDVTNYEQHIEESNIKI